MIQLTVGPVISVRDENTGCIPVQHQHRGEPCHPGGVSSKLIHYRIASPFSQRTRARGLRCCLRAPSRRPCLKKRARPKRRCASAAGPTRPDCSRRSKKRGGRCSRLSISFKGSFGPVLLSVGTAVAVARATVVVAPRTGRIVAAPTRGCRISPAEWRSSNRTCCADCAGRKRASGIDRASRDVRAGGHRIGAVANHHPWPCRCEPAAICFEACEWLVCALALATVRETPRCSDQPKETSVMQAKVVAATAILPKLILFFSMVGCLPTGGVAPAKRKTFREKSSSRLCCRSVLCYRTDGRR